MLILFVFILVFGHLSFDLFLICVTLLPSLLKYKDGLKQLIRRTGVVHIPLTYCRKIVFERAYFNKILTNCVSRGSIFLSQCNTDDVNLCPIRPTYYMSNYPLLTFSYICIKLNIGSILPFGKL